MTAVITEEQNVEAAKIAGGQRVEVIFAKDAISRIIAHTCGEPGLSSVMLELFDYDGDERYFECIPELYGKTFKETLNCFAKAVVFGIRKADGTVLLKPPMDTVVQERDFIILLEEDDRAFELSLEQAEIEEGLLGKEQKNETESKDLLVLGCNDKLGSILTEYDRYAPMGTRVTVIDPQAASLQEEGFKHISLEHDRSEPTDRVLLEKYLEESGRNVLILSDDSLDEDGSEIYMKPVFDYVKMDTPVDFYTVTESAARRVEVAVGYKKIVDGGLAIVTNPLKSEKVSFSEGDNLIVIAED